MGAVTERLHHATLESTEASLAVRRARKVWDDAVGVANAAKKCLDEAMAQESRASMAWVEALHAEPL